MLVAMSGGVDSAVAALLSERRRRVVAVTLELWRDAENDAEALVLLGERRAHAPARWRTAWASRT